MIWREVLSYPDIEASDEGLVRLRPSQILNRGGKSSRVVVPKATPGIWAEKERRYLYALKRRRKWFKVARLVCEAFHGPAPEGKPYVLHRDEDSRNNRPSNLYWGTQKENLNAPGFLAYCRSRTGDNSPYRKGKMA